MEFDKTLEIMDTSLSPQQLNELGNKLFGRLPRVVLYDDIMRVDDIDSIFGDSNGVVIYYPNHITGHNQTYGHYVSMTRNPDDKTIYFYDSYGKKPDVGQKPKDSNEYKELYKEEDGINSLVRLLKDKLKEGWTIDYNEKQLQGKANTSATCGRWGVLRSMFPTIPSEDFNKMIISKSKEFNVSPDYLLSVLIH